ncbi:glycoside hydrolase family 76 protein [Olivibacter sitiensis]|uniref:glycoside hydrolase family 76 protein n=1 Tax=Olivibacter sitiensis TaxID=376470 RepID=UPI000419E13B|nr:glycoside hydrolase family 76 protein [Olivibacter sitiensis]
MIKYSFGWLAVFSLIFCFNPIFGQSFSQKAVVALDSLYAHFDVPGTKLLRETHPFDADYKATYLADGNADRPNPYAYLWPYSSTFSAVNALYFYQEQAAYKALLDTAVLVGLESYLDDKRSPSGYASYINSAPASDRFYDDNIWLGIDFTDLYMQTKEEQYLRKAELIWKFIMSGHDAKLGGGIYWCEQKKHSKNTCSNAPAAVLALKLFKATNDNSYLALGKDIYHWTQDNLQDTTDYLYFDNINLNGRVDKAKYPYNSGQMLEAAVLLYELTGEREYLQQAQQIARASYAYFFETFTDENGKQFALLKNSDVWFIAVMMRGFVALYHADSDSTYVDAFAANLDHAWQHMRDENGLFGKDWSGKNKQGKKMLITQAAMVEMYARLAAIAD